MDLEVSLEDLYSGASIDVEVSKQIICHKCRGSGARSDKDIETCKVCGGRGVTQVKRQMAPGFIVQQEAP